MRSYYIFLKLWFDISIVLYLNKLEPFIIFILISHFTFKRSTRKDYRKLEKLLFEFSILYRNIPKFSISILTVKTLGYTSVFALLNTFGK